MVLPTKHNSIREARPLSSQSTQECHLILEKRLEFQYFKRNQSRRKRRLWKASSTCWARNLRNSQEKDYPLCHRFWRWVESSWLFEPSQWERKSNCWTWEKNSKPWNKDEKNVFKRSLAGKLCRKSYWIAQKKGWNHWVKA